MPLTALAFQLVGIAYDALNSNICSAEMISPAGERQGLEVHTNLGSAAETMLLRQRGRSQRFESVFFDYLRARFTG